MGTTLSASSSRIGASAHCPCSCKNPWQLFLSASPLLSPSAIAFSSRFQNPRRKPPAASCSPTPRRKSLRWAKLFKLALVSATTTVLASLLKWASATRSSTASTQVPTSSSEAMSSCSCLRRTFSPSSTDRLLTAKRLRQVGSHQLFLSIHFRPHGQAHHLQRERSPRS